MLTFLSRKRLIGVEQVLVNIIESAIMNSPYAFQVAWMGGKRTPVQQRELFNDNKSNCDGTIKISKHQNGLAFDIICYDEDGELSWEVDIFTTVAHWIQFVAETQYGIDLEWGGDWKSFKDRPHFQLPKGYKPTKQYGK